MAARLFFVAAEALGLKFYDLACLAGHRAPNVAGYLICSGKQKVVYSSHIATCHPDSGMTEECLDVNSPKLGSWVQIPSPAPINQSLNRNIRNVRGLGKHGVSARRDLVPGKLSGLHEASAASP
jgi:hypothetical protein